MATIINIPETVGKTDSGPNAVKFMTDRELLEELVTATRELRAGIAGAGEALASNPMLKMLGGPIGHLFGGK